METSMISLALLFVLAGTSLAQPAQAASSLTADASAPVVNAAAKPKLIVDDKTGIEFVFVNGGCYQMGDTFGDGKNGEKPTHETCVSAFYLGKYEVTQLQWEKVMGNNPSEFKKCGSECPVDNVSWYMVQEYIKKLNSISGKQYRLPTEAEWEYAARSGGKQEKWAGTSDEKKLGQFAWYDQNSDNMTHRVGLKSPNGLGLFDMSGNVREWCQDWHDEGYYGKSPKNNPTGGKEAEAYGRIVQRGGDIEGNAWKARNAYRNSNTPDLTAYFYGFRLLLPAN